MSIEAERRGTAPAGALVELDARGLLCPLPVLKARKRLAALSLGDILRLRADDPAAPLDVAHFCREQGHALLGERACACGAREFDIRKGTLAQSS